jgi:hypothetical protein
VRDDRDEPEAGLRQHPVEAKAGAVPKLDLDRRMLDLALAREALDVTMQALHEVFVRAGETRDPELGHRASVLLLRLRSELELVPGRHRCELEERSVAARVPVAEVGGGFVPRHVEEAGLHALVEPGASENELS